MTYVSASAPVGSGGNRLDWVATPEPVRRSLEAHLGSRVVEARSQVGGFSPGVAARLLLADGRRFFVKAVGVSRNPLSPDMFRREARIVAALPPEAPVGRLLWTYDDGDWVALVFADIDGRTPSEPWRRAELDRVLSALPALWDALTPTPIQVTTLAEDWAEDFREWSALTAMSPRAGLADADPWAANHLDLLAGLEVGSAEAAHGTTLLHGDLRADNVLLTDDGVVFIDWPAALIGPAWADLVFMLPSVGMHGFDPEEIFSAQPVARTADPDAVTSLVAGVAGYFIGNSLKPQPPGLPLVRAFQLAQGRAALAWLRTRLAR
jgi:aminoglycoside phosphotransferase (APT) family kinase protein